MEIELSYDPKLKRLYLKEDIAKVLGESKAIQGLANFKTVLLYSPDTEYDVVLDSLEVLKLDLINRKKEQEKNKESNSKNGRDASDDTNTETITESQS